MSTIIPSYAYTYIKMTFLKQLIISDISLQKLEEIEKIEDLIDFISPFYPGLSIKKITIKKIEQALFHNYFKLIGKIMQYSPTHMRTFLGDFLLKYEIMNIKQIILGSILGMNIQEKTKLVNFLIEEYLGNTIFIKDLLKISSLDEIQLYMKNTKYYRVIREGILYFKNNKEIFVLEAFLDQLYYKYLLEKEYNFNHKERAMINLYLDYKTEIYNLNMIYRGIKNNIDKNLLTQFLIDNYLFFDENKIEYLLNLDNEKDFILTIDNILRTIKEILPFYRISGINEKHLIVSIEKLYQNYYFKKFQIKIDDIDYSTIYKIMELVIKKENEIKFVVLPKAVKITHEKFRKLKSNLR